MTTPSGHQGGLLKSVSARALAPLPVHRNDTGAKREDIPAGVKIPNMRQTLSSNEVCQRMWVREIIDRKGSVEEMLTTAIQRVADDRRVRMPQMGLGIYVVDRCCEEVGGAHPDEVTTPVSIRPIDSGFDAVGQPCEECSDERLRQGDPRGTRWLVGDRCRVGHRR